MTTWVQGLLSLKTYRGYNILFYNRNQEYRTGATDRGGAPTYMYMPGFSRVGHIHTGLQGYRALIYA